MAENYRRALTEEEIPSAFKNVYGDRTKEPISVQTAKVLKDFTPFGLGESVNEIKEELQKENPNYYKIGAIGGLEAIGLIPGLDKLAIDAIKAGAKKFKLTDNTVIDALDVPKPNTESQIIAGKGATDYEGRALDKAKQLRRRGYTAKQIEEMTGRFTTESPGDYIQQQGVKQGEVFKFEIPDKGIIIKQNDGVINYKEATNISPMLVGDMIPTHKKLFEQYPDLKNVKFYIDPNLGQEAHFNPFVGQLDPNTGKRTGAIVFGADYPGINNVNSPQFRETFFHELQHATQHQDFLKGSLDQLGGNPTGYTKTITARNPYGDTYQEATILKNSKAVKLKDEIIDLFEKEYLEVGATSVSIKTPSAKVAQKMANLMRDLEAQSFKTYLQTASEVEAGAVGFRAIPTSGASQEKMYSEIAKRKKIETNLEFRRKDKNTYNPRPDSRIEKIFKKITSQFKKMDEIETMRYNEGGVNFAKYALGMDDKLQGFDTFGVKGTYNKGGYTVRPEPIDGVDISPRAEAGDQFFVKQAERERAFETKPMPRPSMDKSFPNVKPKPRPEGRSEFITRGYEVDGREIQVGIIKFKGGEEIALDKVLQNIDTKGTADETPVLTERTILQVLDFVKEKNPTRKEFETYWYNKRLNKGGAMMDKQMQMAFMDEGGLTDDGMDVDPVSGNDIPSGSMAEEVRDDIPAQLSDGEYVVPADVVRYYGVKFFEDLRERAKMGLQEMEMNGRIGGESVPAGGPINTEELSPEEMQAIQEMMGMSQGGSVNAYKAQQELLEQPPAKAVGNPVMMYGGGDVEADMLGGKTSAQVEQDFLDQGNKASNDPYIGEDLGFSIFGPSNNQQGVQQTEVKPFTPITLYNTAGQTRTVNSEAEEKSARAADFTMTLEQYNMYRSQRGGSGGTGGGSGIITPPGEGEDQEVKPWGQDLKDWNNVDDIKQFVAQAERGNLSGSGRFLRGAGFAIAGMTGVALAGAFQSFKGLNGLYDIEAAQIIAEAKGKAGSKEHADLAKKLKTDINTYLEKAGDITNFFYKPRSKNVMNKVNGVFVGTDYEDVDSWAAGTRRTTVSDYKKGKGFDSKKSKQAGDSRKQKARQAFNNLQKNKDSYIKSSTDSVQTAKNVADLEKSLSASSQNPSGTVSLNRGGLMQKKKKAKK